MGILESGHIEKHTAVINVLPKKHLLWIAGSGSGHCGGSWKHVYRGFNAKSGENGPGLLNMQPRTPSVGGNRAIDSQAGSGTLITNPMKMASTSHWGTRLGTGLYK